MFGTNILSKFHCVRYKDRKHTDKLIRVNLERSGKREKTIKRKGKAKWSVENNDKPDKVERALLQLSDSNNFWNVALSRSLRLIMQIPFDNG